MPLNVHSKFTYSKIKINDADAFNNASGRARLNVLIIIVVISDHLSVLGCEGDIEMMR